jgi:hypothetical protein
MDGPEAAEGRSAMNTRRARAGFSFVEVMISCAVLGFGLLGLVTLYTSSARGAVRGRMTSTALNLIVQRSAELSARDAVQLVTQCPLSGGRIDCRIDQQTESPSKPCTVRVNEQGATTGATRPYRIDTVVQMHPSRARHPDVRLATISVCWRDESGLIQQMQNQVVLAPSE